MPVKRPLAPERGAAAPGHGAHEEVLGVDVPGQRVARGEARGGARGPGAGEGVLGTVMRGQLLFGGEARAAVRAQAEEEVCSFWGLVYRGCCGWGRNLLLLLLLLLRAGLVTLLLLMAMSARLLGVLWWACMSV